jgi:hypothetical protein
MSEIALLKVIEKMCKPLDKQGKMTTLLEVATATGRAINKKMNNDGRIINPLRKI